MALFSQNMAELAIELAAHDPTYEDMVLKFAEHFYYIARAMNRPGLDSMWTRKTASTTTCCGSPTAAPRGSKCAPCGATAPVRHHGRRRVAAGAYSRAFAQLQKRLRRIPNS